MIKTYYLAYGSNLCESDMARRCKDARPIDDSFIEDYKLTFRDGRANIEPCEGSRVPVGVWIVSYEDIQKLDSHEGYPELHDRKIVKFNKDGFMLNGIVYIMKDGHKLRKPDSAYIEKMREGYRNFLLDMSYLDKALADVIDE